MTLEAAGNEAAGTIGGNGAASGVTVFVSGVGGGGATGPEAAEALTG